MVEVMLDEESVDYCSECGFINNAHPHITCSKFVSECTEERRQAVEIGRRIKTGVCIDCNAAPVLEGRHEEGDKYIRCGTCQRTVEECKLCGSIDHSTFKHQALASDFLC